MHDIRSCPEASPFFKKVPRQRTAEKQLLLLDVAKKVKANKYTTLDDFYADLKTALGNPLNYEHEQLDKARADTVVLEVRHRRHEVSWPVIV